MTTAVVQKLSIKHNAIMDFMIANPEMLLGDVAKKFGVTPGWLSQLIHSSLFQAELAYKKEVMFGELTITIKDRITNIAHGTLNKLEQLTDAGALSVDQTLDLAELTLKSLGFGAPKTQGQIQPQVGQQNIFIGQSVTPQILQEARAAMLTKPETPAIEGEIVHASEPSPARVEPVLRSEHPDDNHVPEVGQLQVPASGSPVGGGQRGTFGEGVAKAGFGSFGGSRIQKGEGTAPAPVAANGGDRVGASQPGTVPSGGAQASVA